MMRELQFVVVVMLKTSRRADLARRRTFAFASLQWRSEAQIWSVITKFSDVVSHL
ncbi:MAG: hypothetical protein KKG76_07015 [Euryarchaeota archaeon]|nr:hypothetical protein [Euryarchaeota archaeon]MBU4139418.1 hypothetical protein [Euryarchaeota archaeon]